MATKRPKAYVSIPKHVDEDLVSAYLNFLRSIGYSVGYWEKGTAYRRSIMDDIDIHFIIYDFNEQIEAKNGYLPKGCYSEAKYAKEELKVPTYLIYLPVSNTNGLGFFNYKINRNVNENDWVNYSEVKFDSRMSIIRVLYNSYIKLNEMIHPEEHIMKMLDHVKRRYVIFIDEVDDACIDKLSHYNMGHQALWHNWSEPTTKSFWKNFIEGIKNDSSNQNKDYIDWRTLDNPNRFISMTRPKREEHQEPVKPKGSIFERIRNRR